LEPEKRNLKKEIKQMSHEQIQEQVSRLVDNALREDESAALFAHLAECGACRQFLQLSIQIRSGLAQDLPVPSTAVDAKLRRQFSGATVQSSHIGQSLWRQRVGVRVPVLMLLLCFVAAGAVLALSGRSFFRDPETIYVTRLPAVVVTNSSGTTVPGN